MKLSFYKGLFLLLIGTILISTTSCEDTNAATSNAGGTSASKAESVDGKTFKDILNKNHYTLVDVRTPNEYKKGTIPGAKNINVSGSTFKADIQKLDKSKPVMVFCRSGARSGRAMHMMSKLGFTHIYNLKGGYMGWKRAGL